MSHDDYFGITPGQPALVTGVIQVTDDGTDEYVLPMQDLTWLPSKTTNSLWRVGNHIGLLGVQKCFISVRPARMKYVCEHIINFANIYPIKVVIVPFIYHLNECYLEISLHGSFVNATSRFLPSLNTSTNTCMTRQY